VDAFAVGLKCAKRRASLILVEGDDFEVVVKQKKASKSIDRGRAATREQDDACLVNLTADT